MKIAWFTPFSIKSAIGGVSRIICEGLQKEHQVDIWTSETGAVYDSSVQVIRFDATARTDRLKKYDHVVYNMGNFAGYHRDIYDMSLRYPGVVILHDQSQHGFFYQSMLLAEYGGDPLNGFFPYRELLARYYGELGWKAAEKVYSEAGDRLWESPGVSQFPLLEPVIENATGIFTHAKFFADRLKSEFPGNVGYAYLPMLEPSKTDFSLHLPSFVKERGKRLLIVSTGIVHQVKQIDRMVGILQKNQEIANEVCYVVIGEYGGRYGEELKRLSDTTLKDCFHLMGRQSNEVMFACLDAADACVNMRYPNSEVCSLSLLEQMQRGKPVIVLDTGIYAEIPGEAMLRIPYTDLDKRLEVTLLSLIRKKTDTQSIGRNAEHFVRENCGAEQYVRRLTDFLDSVEDTRARAKLIRNTLAKTNATCGELGFEEASLPDLFEGLARRYETLLGSERPTGGKEKVLGVWFGFAYEVSLKREGITRFIVYMLQGLLEHMPDVRCEVWCYAVNEPDIKESFKVLFENTSFQGRVVLVTERNWRKSLQVSEDIAQLPIEGDIARDNLGLIARRYSRAECFVPAILYLDNVLQTGKRICVPAHDMTMNDHYDEFITNEPLNKARFPDITARAENLARADAYMFCLSDTVRRGQVLPGIQSLRENMCETVYVPVNVPIGIEKRLIEESVLRKKFELTKPYLFYPTQVRPYKNVELLIKALQILVKKGLNAQLALTGNPADLPEVENLILEYGLQKRIVRLGGVTEEELFSLYKYAAAMPTPSLFEGGFPLQAAEALFMGTPTLISSIPVSLERIRFAGMTPENCGIGIFDPFDEKMLADQLAIALKDREAAVRRQSDFAQRLLSYGWKEASKRYYDILFMRG